MREAVGAVNGEIFDFQDARFAGQQVHRFHTNHAGDSIGPYEHCFARQNAVVDVAHRAELQRAIAIRAEDHESDLIQMRVEHHAHFRRAVPRRAVPRRAARALHRQQITDGVHAQFVNVISNQINHDFADNAFVARDAVGIGEVLEVGK